jgi:hypothetical protein
MYISSNMALAFADSLATSILASLLQAAAPKTKALYRARCLNGFIVSSMVLATLPPQNKRVDMQRELFVVDGRDGIDVKQ